MSRRRALIGKATEPIYEFITALQAAGSGWVPIDISLSESAFPNLTAETSAIFPSVAPASLSMLISFSAWSGYWFGRGTNGYITIGGNVDITGVTVTTRHTYVQSWDSVWGTLTVGEHSARRQLSTGNPISLSVFGRPTGTQYLSSATLYSFTIKQSGTTIHDFKPAKRLSDRALGLYDTVTGVFYPGSGTLYEVT